MNTGRLVATVLILMTAAPALAVTRPTAHRPTREEVKQKYFGHPKAHPISNSDVKLQVTYDQIMRSCCMPPNLLISGTIKNVSNIPIDYLKLGLDFKDVDGKVVFHDEAYNGKAVSLGEDEMVAQVLKEKRHFDPLPSGAEDKFTFSVILTEVPRYQTVEITVTQVARNTQTAATEDTAR